MFRPSAVNAEIERLEDQAARWDRWNTDPELSAQIRAQMEGENAQSQPSSRATPAATPADVLDTGSRDASQALDAADRPENFSLSDQQRSDAQAAAEAQAAFNADPGEQLGGATQAGQAASQAARARRANNAPAPDTGGGLFAQSQREPEAKPQQPAPPSAPASIAAIRDNAGTNALPPASRVTARKGSDGRYRLMFTGTTNEVAPGETFKSAGAARSWYKALHAKAAEQQAGESSLFSRPDPDAALTAPNGAPSNLNARQHAQVRTPAFKRWFGDWETAYRQMPAVDLKLEGWQGSAADLGRMARQVYAGELQGQTVTNDSLGHAVVFSAEGKGEAFGARGKLRKPVRAKLVRALRDIVGAAQAVQKSAPETRRRHDTRAFHTLVAPLRASGTTYSVKVTVRQALRSQKTPPHKFYDVTAIDISESPGVHGVDDRSSRPAPAEASNSSVAELARAFNIDLDVSQVVDANGEPLAVYHGTTADFDAFEIPGGKEPGIFFTDNADAAQQWAGSGLFRRGSPGGNVIPSFFIDR